MLWCPIAKQDCKVSCSLFINGECCFVSLFEIAEKLEDINASIESLEQTLKNTNFTE